MKATAPIGKRCDALFSKAIRLRDKVCLRCGSPDRLQAAHVISRRYRATRYDPANCYALCLRCHKWETEHPLEGQDFWRSLGVDYDGLRVIALAHVPVDYKATELWLRDWLKALEAA